VACDLIVASGPEVVRTLRADSRIIANQDVVPTGEFQTRKDLDLSPDNFLAAFRGRVEDANVALLRANELAARLLGDTIFTNLMMVGFAAQKGLLPVGLDAIEQAVRLNGTAVEANLQAFAIGRLAAVKPRELLAFAQLEAPAVPVDLEGLVERGRRYLTDYQDDAYARCFTDFMADLAAVAGGAQARPFLMQVAEQLARLMAYKDEYEVARLYSLPAFREGLAAQFDGDYKVSLNLAPPLLSWRRDARTGRPRKIAFGPWIFPVFKLLAGMKRLRGTPFDIFGMTAERRMERRLIVDYRDLVMRLAKGLTGGNIDRAVEIAGAARLIAGYGPVKEAGVAAWQAKVAELMQAL